MTFRYLGIESVSSGKECKYREVYVNDKLYYVPISEAERFLRDKSEKPKIPQTALRHIKNTGRSYREQRVLTVEIRNPSLLEKISQMIEFDERNRRQGAKQ